jgi:xanthine dehydrogenase YagS FAD-binding subunit
MCVAMAALGATVEVKGTKGERKIPFAEFHKLPGKSPWVETTLGADELITAVTLPVARFSKNAYYLKVRDRNSYAFALISVAAGLEMDGETVKSAGIALGGVALKPWRKAEAEKALAGKSPGPEAFASAAEILLSGAKGYEHNMFKIELAKQSVVRALTLASKGTTEGAQA